MKKLFTILFVVVLLLAGLIVVAMLNPQDNGVQWLTVRFSETLKEKNELLVYSGEKTGCEIYQKNAPLLGTVQEVTLPYTFSFDFSVDLSKAVVDVSGSKIYVRVPGPRLTSYKMVVNDNEVERSGIRALFTADKYTELKRTLESRLLSETQSNEEYATEAWNITVRNLTNLLQSVAQANSVTSGYTIEVVRDDTLLHAVHTEPTTTDVAPSSDTPGTVAVPAQ